VSAAEPGANAAGKKSAIRAVTFDVGGTLIEPWPSVGHIYAEVAARHGHRQISPSLLNRNFKNAWNSFKHFQHTQSDWQAVVEATFRGLVESCATQAFFNELYARFAEAQAWRVFDDVQPTLLNLKARGLRLGIVSNWDERLRPLLRALDLDVYFETISVSCEVGESKPAARPFLVACAELGVKPGETLHVGDSLEMDVLGARNGGLQARCIRRQPAGDEPTVIDSLRELDKI
jgi:putative hydrolase of the HAD superfamily